MAESRRPDVVRGKTIEEGGVFDIASLFPSWETGTVYAPMQIVRFENELFQIMQGHTSQSDWTPSTVPALYKKIGFTEDGVTIWVQPQGAHDAYQMADVVSFDGQIWESTANNNVWQPGVYGWIIKV